MFKKLSLLATIRPFPRHRRLVAAGAAAATIALLAAMSGVAQAGYTDQSFPVPGVSASILAPSYASNATIRVSATCSRVTHNGAVSLALQAPPLLTSGLMVEAQVWVKNHWALSYAGAAYVGYALKRVYPTTINGFTDLIGTKLFYGAPGGAYDVGVWYRYLQPNGQWTGWGSFQETMYSTVINSWNNVLDTTTSWT
jgi:hypothetical protein